MWRLGRPKTWMLHREMLFKRFAVVDISYVSLMSHYASGIVFDFRVNGQLASVGTHHFGAQAHRSIISSHVRRGDLRTPHRHMDALCLHHLHFAVEAGAGIPSARLGFVFKMHSQQVWGAVLTQKLCHIAMKRVVSIRPKDGFVAIHIDLCLTHGSFKNQRDHFARCGGKLASIPAFPHIGQSAGSSRLDCGFFFKILCDGHLLQVVVA